MRITLEAARVSRKHTQESISDMIGVHRQTYASWEKDPSKMSISEAEKVCKILGYDFDDIFFSPTLQNVENRKEK